MVQQCAKLVDFKKSCKLTLVIKILILAKIGFDIAENEHSKVWAMKAKITVKIMNNYE